MKKYIERNNQIEMVWKITYESRLFQHMILVRGTENEMRDYLESEFGYIGRYSACTQQELDAAEILNIPVYIAPKL